MIQNKEEYIGFFRNALSWGESVSPKVLRATLVSTLYASIVGLIIQYYPNIILEIGPFEYSGAFLGVLLVFRINSGYDRWWEARKLWGSIVNQTRNLAIIGLTYSKAPLEWRESFKKWVLLIPHLMRRSLRGQEANEELMRVFGTEIVEESKNIKHLPVWNSTKISKLLNEARQKSWLDDFSFQRAERERAILIDDIGACERILKTPIPFIFVIKLKRFILLFLIFLPFALFPKLGAMAILVTLLVSYSLFSLDRMGYELQNPFDQSRLSHLPLTQICETIEMNVLEIEKCSRE